MLRLYCKAKSLWATRDRGATAAEYVLLISFVAAALVTVIALFQGEIASIFNDTCDKLNNASSSNTNTC